MSARISPWIWAFLTLSLLLPSVAAGADEPVSVKAPPLKDWIDGPIRYIATKEEARRFRALDDDRERALFVERFWQRRDPTPGTITNEYRFLFWNRVQEANEMVFSSAREGWITDRGKIYILYGPPTHIESFHDVRTQGIAGGGEGLIRWIYEGRPGGRTDVDPVTVVAFVGDRTGEYKLSFDPSLSSVFFDVAEYEDPHPFAGSLGIYTPSRSDLSVMLDLGRLQEVPPHEQVLLERVETFENYHTFDLGLNLHRHVDDRGRLGHSITLDFSDTELAGEPALLARFTPADATKASRILGEGSFRFVPAADGHPALAQARIVLEPGRYELMAAAIDPTGAGNGIVRRTVVVPAPPSTPSLRHADPLLCHLLEPVPYASLASYVEPFVVGPYRCLPRLGSELARGRPIELLFEVVDGEPPFSLAYHLERRAEEIWRPLGRPQTLESADRAFAWGLDTSERWPLGAYRVRVVVRDAAGEEVEFEVPVTLVEP